MVDFRNSGLCANLLAVLDSTYADNQGKRDHYSCSSLVDLASCYGDKRATAQLTGNHIDDVDKKMRGSNYFDTCRVPRSRNNAYGHASWTSYKLFVVVCSSFCDRGDSQRLLPA